MSKVYPERNEDDRNRRHIVDVVIRRTFDIKNMHTHSLDFVPVYKERIYSKKIAEGLEVIRYWENNRR